MKQLLPSLLLLASTCAASASGGLSCTVDDANLAFLVEAGVTRGMGGPVFALEGEAELRDAGVAEDLRRTAFGREHLAQYWLDGQELRLLLYRERSGEAPFGSVEIVVLTKMSEEGLYDGRYQFSISDMTGDMTGEGRSWDLEGAVSCFVE
jgi:hypothetical protein